MMEVKQMSKEAKPLSDTDSISTILQAEASLKQNEEIDESSNLEIDDFPKKKTRSGSD